MAPTLRTLKLHWLRLLSDTGMFDRVARSRWRSQRLAILCYHGVSTLDEHDWNDQLYVPPALLSARLSLLEKEGCYVCSLEEGVRRVREGTLPPRSVALTFDDGVSDFATAAWPLLSQRGYPAVVYLTSYYSGVQLPVFGPFCSYLLWAGRCRETLEDPDFGLPRDYRLSSPQERASAVAALRERCRALRLCALQRHEVAMQLAERLGIDVAPLVGRRLLHVMDERQVSAVAADGAAVELHTHRHRLPAQKLAFFSELSENEAFIQRCTSRRPKHFCYPSGEWRPDLFGWLAEYGVESATVGEKGYVVADTPRMALPRFADTCGVTELEFRAWVTGAFQLVPRRPERRPAA